MTVIIRDAELRTLLNSESGFIAKELLRRALSVEREAKRLCPVDTGRLRSSISHDLASDSRGIYARIGSSVRYAAYVELGTRNARAQPYLRPALKAAVR